MKKIKGNIDPTYKLRDDEKGYVHIRTIEKNHRPLQKDYNVVKSVRKLTPVQHRWNLANDFYNRYDGVEVLHDPDAEENSNTGTKETVKVLEEKYQKLFGNPAPNVNKPELEKMVRDKEAEMLEDVKADYLSVMDEDPSNDMDIYQMIDTIEKAVEK